MTEKSSHPAGGANSTGALYSGLQPGLVPQSPELGILVDVFVLYNNGVRLSSAARKASAPLRGRLIVKTEARPRMSGEEYYVHLAELSEPKRLTAYSGGLCAPLFDPSIVTASARGIFLRGRQLDSSSGALIEFCQMWKVIPVFDPSE